MSLSHPKKCGARKAPPKVVQDFVKYVNQSENSEPEDSGTPPVFISKGIKSPVRHLTKAINSIINDYSFIQVFPCIDASGNQQNINKN